MRACRPGLLPVCPEAQLQLTYGSISVHDVLGSPMFVMSRTFLRGHVRPEDLRDAIVEIARRSDRIEKQLTWMDQY